MRLLLQQRAVQFKVKCVVCQTFFSFFLQTVSSSYLFRGFSYSYNYYQLFVSDNMIRYVIN